MHLGIATALFGIAMLISPAPARAAPFDCVANHCGILHDAPLRDFVVGTVDGVATPSQSAALLQTAQTAGYWHLFPASANAFAEKIQPISVKLENGQSITVLAAVDETRFLRLQNGELIRFAPHRGLHEKPRPNDPYWVGVGCVAPLCLMGDAGCVAGYRTGLFRLADGVQLDKTGARPLPGGAVIDTMSMRPKPP